MQKRKLLIAGVSGVVLTAGSVTFAATALAAPAAPSVIKACVADKGGAMYQVPSKTTKCARGQHLVTWNQTGVQGAPGKAGTTGASGRTGPQGPTGARGPAGPQGPQGAPGLAGLDGTNIAWGIGPASQDVVDAAEAGDFYLDLTTDNVSVAVFDGTVYGESVPLQGEKGETGAQGIQGEKGETGAQGIQGEKGETGAQGIQGEKGETGAQGIQGEKGDAGKSVTVQRRPATSPAVNSTARTLTVSCAEGETAIGAGYSGLAEGALLVGSDAGTLPTDWVLTFSADPGADATGTALCAATV
ncbi:hypothetical protein [Geodermatophilus sp. URMC 60]